jgi:hypothetical protein
MCTYTGFWSCRLCGSVWDLQQTVYGTGGGCAAGLFTGRCNWMWPDPLGSQAWGPCRTWQHMPWWGWRNPAMCLTREECLCSLLTGQLLKGTGVGWQRRSAGYGRVLVCLLGIPVQPLSQVVHPKCTHVTRVLQHTTHRGCCDCYVAHAWHGTKGQAPAMPGVLPATSCCGWPVCVC